MKVARVNSSRLPILTGPGGLGGANQSPPAGLTLDDLTDVDTTGVVDGDVLTFEYGEWIALPGGTTPTTMWVPVMVEDGATGLWYVTVTGDGDAVMTEVPI
jgi:hypothetical protein